MGDKKCVVYYDEVLKDTGEGGATLFLIDGEEKWVPNSLIEFHREDLKEFEVPLWFAEKEGLE